MKKFLVLLLPLFLFGCKDDEANNIDSQLLEANRQLLEDFFAEYEPQGNVWWVNAEDWSTIFSDKATFNLNPYFFHANGDEVDGEMQIEFRELYHKSDFLFANKQTITNNGELLQSAGIFYVKATQNGETLKLRGHLGISYKYENIYPAMAVDEADSMEIYKGIIDGNGTIKWINAENPSTASGVRRGWVNFSTGLILVIGTTDSLNNVVDTTFENLGWINCDDILNDTLPTTSVSVTVDGSLGGEAVAEAFIVFKDINSVLNLYQAGTTFESPDNIPITFTATVVVVAVNDGVYYFGTKEITVAATNNITVPVAETSKADMVAAIKTLDD